LRPPRSIPSDLLSCFTLNGQIPVRDWYFDDSQKNMDCFYESHVIESYIQKAKKREPISYERTDPALYDALGKYSVEGKTVLVVGSEKPAYEALVLADGGGGMPIVVEYRTIVCSRKDVLYVTEEQYRKNPVMCDCAFSISSFEHTGLCRYGETLDPEGDLNSMRELKNRIVKGGLLYLAVPVGKDVLYFNAMRVYGRIRFPMLIDGWELVESFGFEDKMFDDDPTGPGYVQPVFVLRNT
jgi:hypothetical protein